MIGEILTSIMLYLTYLALPTPIILNLSHLTLLTYLLLDLVYLTLIIDKNGSCLVSCWLHFRP